MRLCLKAVALLPEGVCVCVHSVRHTYSIHKITFAGDMAQLVQGLPSQHEALSLIPGSKQT